MLSLRHGCRDLVRGGRIVPEEHSFHLGLADYLSVNRDLRLICLTEAVRAVEVDPGLVGAEWRQCAFDAAELRRRCTADQEERRKDRSKQVTKSHDRVSLRGLYRPNVRAHPRCHFFSPERL